MNVLDHVHSVLERDGYSVRWGESSDWLEFEDASVFGGAWIFASAKALIGEWKDAQSRFLQRHQPGFQRFGDKSWNAYVVLLSSSDAPPGSWEALSEIEENFHGARKIVRSGVQSRSSAERAIRPLLRLQSRAVLEDSSASDRLTTVDAIDASLRMELLDGTNSQELVRYFLGENE